MISNSNIYQLIPFSFNNISDVTSQLLEKKWYDSSSDSYVFGASISKHLQNFLGVNKDSGGLVECGTSYSVLTKIALPQICDCELSLNKNLIGKTLPKVHLTDKLLVILDSTAKKGLFIYGFEVKDCSWNDMLSISSLMRTMDGGLSLFLTAQNSTSKEYDLLSLLGTCVGREIVLYDRFTEGGYTERWSHIAAMALHDSNEAELINDSLFEAWGKGKTPIDNPHLLSIEKEIVSIGHSTRLCTSEFETLIVRNKKYNELNFTLTSFYSCYLPIIASCFFLKIVAVSLTSNLDASSIETVAHKLQQIKFLISSSASHSPVPNIVFNQCKTAQRVSQDIEAINVLLSYKVEKENKERYSREAASDHRRDVGITVLTISQVLFALISYLGIKDILGDPAGQPWITISGIIIIIMLLAFFVLILRKRRD